MKVTDKSKQQLMAEIGQLREQITQLELANRTYQAIFDKAPMLISAKDINGTILMANQRCGLIKNDCDQQFVGKNVYDAFPAKVADVIWQNDLMALSSNDLLEIEEVIIHANDEKHVYYTVIFPLEDQQQNTFGVGSLSYDITQISHSKELSITDPLTSLYTWRYFNMRFGGELFRASEQQSLFTMLLIDIDQFEHYRQNYCKQWSDDVVITVAGAIQNVCSLTHDLCFRFSEQRMACLLSVNDHKDAMEIAEEIRYFIEALAIEHDYSDSHQQISISIGLTIINYEDHYDQQQICQMTEAALFNSQKQGGNKVSVAQRPD